MTVIARDEEQPYLEAPPEVVRALGGQHPTVQQWAAISHPLTPAAVVAGAGSGKTAVMAARVVYLALVASGRLPAGHAGALPSQVLCLTFTNKAAEELGRRVRDAVAGLDLPEGEEPTVHTYHAFAARLLNDYGLRMGMESGLHLLSEAERWTLMKSLLADREFEVYEVRSDYIMQPALSLADQIANHLAAPTDVARVSRAFADELPSNRKQDRDAQFALRKRAEVAELVEAYQTRKRELGVIDYGDQIALAVELVEENPAVVADFRERFPVVLLDEYQDTNVAQARMLRALCGLDYPVMAVGDPDQNIYAWRGASLKNILRFHADFSSGKADRLPLYVNFRSGSRILDVANAVIGEVPAERRGEDKELWPHPKNGEGRVVTFIAADAYSEGRRIAALLKAEVAKRAGDGELKWDEVAILCRKKRLFGPIAEVLREEGVPVEVIDLGGLLQMPEIVDLVAWIRLLEDPGRNIHLVRLLQGPRWRVGYRDIVALARWSARNNAELRGQVEDGDDMPGDVLFALAEALDHIDDPEMSGLSDEGRERLRGFRDVLASVRDAAKGPLDDLVAQIAERSGLLAELEASRDPAALGRRRNVLNLMQHVAAFSPVGGEASLSTLVSYFDTAEETNEDIEQAQPSDANTVKLLTIHKAKGLEWPVVFVPGLSEHESKNSSIFPDVSRQANPITYVDALPFELRGDADVLPQYEGDLRAFREALKERGMEEERRLCYVALTRAKELLICSGAYWYPGPADPLKPGRFLEQIVNHEASEIVAKEECPEESPLLQARAQRAAAWPPAARWGDVDELFPEGWHAAAVSAVSEPASVEERVAALPAGEQAAFRSRLEGDLERAALIQERTAPDRAPATPSTLSVSSMIDYLRCPKLFFWSHVRPLPRRSSVAARVGTEVHRWIELQSRGQATLLEVDDLPDLGTEERMGEPGKVAGLKHAFKASRFGERVPLHTERPFLLYLDGFVVGGRIDAIYEREGGGWEVVDYKTGRVPPAGDDLSGLQLDLYALACADVWAVSRKDLTLTYLYLGEEAEVSREAGNVEETRARVVAALKEMAAGGFEPRPGPQCRWCDFLPFCEPGKASLGGG